ncbi:MAG TPA: hypothetical protein VLN90_02810 [Thioalkalivibrio sp.]|nr:hypothetical protein [Thioalkalivibrio sp.]
MPQALAELGSDAYVPDGRPLSEEEREAVRQRIEAEREAARSRREREAATREVQVEDPRPFPERLTEQRCMGCHGRDLYVARGYTRLSAELTVLRMQWLHGAHIEAGERSLISTYLAQQHPQAAQRSQGLLLITAVLIVAMTLIVLVLIRRGKRSKRGI